ncbi:MAG: Rieske 2Fe-2S domain-containing protein, partial [Chloroflexota bacterium]
TEQFPNSSDWFGRFRLTANSQNDYKLDRAKQRSGQQYTGIEGINLQDQAITESMGATFDRSIEHLGTSDAMIIRVRRRLLAAARELAANGTPPPGAENPGAYAVRAGGVILAKGTDWVKETRDLVKAYLEHPEIDVAIGG